MPSAQEHRLKKEEDDDENATNVASEPSSRTYTPPLPPLATPEYVRYLQEQRILERRRLRKRLRETTAIRRVNLLLPPFKQTPLLRTLRTLIIIIIIIILSIVCDRRLLLAWREKQRREIEEQQSEKARQPKTKTRLSLLLLDQTETRRFRVPGRTRTKT